MITSPRTRCIPGATDSIEIAAVASAPGSITALERSTKTCLNFVVLGGPTNSTTRLSIDADYLGPQHAGVPLATRSSQDHSRSEPRPAALSGRTTATRIRTDRPAQRRWPLSSIREDPALRARIRAYELAFRMQAAVPEAARLFARNGVYRASSTAWTTSIRVPPGSGFWWRGAWPSGAFDSCRSIPAPMARGIRTRS